MDGTLVAAVGIVEHGQAAEVAHVAARASGIVWGGLCAFHGIDVFRFPISDFTFHFFLSRHCHASRCFDEEVGFLVETDEFAALPLAEHHVGSLLCLLLLGIGLVHVFASE